MTRTLLTHPLETLGEKADREKRSGSKYGNKITEVDGIKFRSRKEARRYEQLKLLQRQGVIAGLELQPRYPLHVNGIKVTTYVADFRYRDVQSNELIVEDVKGAKTLLYKMKAKLFQAIHGFPVQEI